MYKGNMQDFCHKVNEYLQREYSSLLQFGKIDNSYFVAFFHPYVMSTSAYEVFDTEDFEQQIYDFVNNELEDVQEEYDGLPEQPDKLFGEEI